MRRCQIDCTGAAPARVLQAGEEPWQIVAFERSRLFRVEPSVWAQPGIFPMNQTISSRPRESMARFRDDGLRSFDAQASSGARAPGRKREPSTYQAATATLQDGMDLLRRHPVLVGGVVLIAALLLSTRTAASSKPKLKRSFIPVAHGPSRRVSGHRPSL